MKHEVIDQRNLEMDKLIVKKLKQNPVLLERVLHRVERVLEDPNSSRSLKENWSDWKKIILQGLPRVIEVLEDETLDTTLRQSSPFSELITEKERLTILEKYESYRV